MKLWFSLQKLRQFRTFFDIFAHLQSWHWIHAKESEERWNRKWGKRRGRTQLDVEKWDCDPWAMRGGRNGHLCEFGGFCCPACCLLIIFHNSFWSRFFRRRRKSCCVRSQIFRWELVRFPCPLASGRLPHWCQFGNLTSERALVECDYVTIWQCHKKIPTILNRALQQLDGIWWILMDFDYIHSCIQYGWRPKKTLH